ILQQQGLSEDYAGTASRPRLSITHNARRYIHLDFIQTERCGAACWHLSIAVLDKMSSQDGRSWVPTLIMLASIADEAGRGSDSQISRLIFVTSLAVDHVLQSSIIERLADP